MKKFIFLILLFFSFHSQVNAQAYVKFAKEPKMRLRPASSYSNYSIAYKALKKSTIYLELKRGNQLVGTGVYLINKASTKTVNIPIKILGEVKALKPGNDYNYNLYMYEGGRNDWSVKACKTKVIEGVNMIVNEFRKPILINTFN